MLLKWRRGRDSAPSALPVRSPIKAREKLNGDGRGPGGVHGGCAATLAPHGGHGDGGAGHSGVLGLPLRRDGLDLSVELDALVVRRENCGVSSTATVAVCATVSQNKSDISDFFFPLNAVKSHWISSCKPHCDDGGITHLNICTWSERVMWPHTVQWPVNVEKSVSVQKRKKKNLRV